MAQRPGRPGGRPLLGTLETLAELDLIYAKARLASTTG